MIFNANPDDSINEILKLMSPGDTLVLSEGIYNEKVNVLVSNITIKGIKKENVIISNHDFFHKIMPDYNECNTFRTYTVYVGSENVTIKDLTIENTSTPAAKYGQAVALHVDSNNFICDNVILKSAQDTLFTGPLPDDLIIRHTGFLDKPFLKDKKAFQKYSNCKIYGNIDFIFGTATALFENCDIISIKDNNNSFESSGYLCAPAHSKDTLFGYLFLKCNLISMGDLKNIYLARPWRDYGCVAFIQCNLGEHINALGFNKWNNTNRDKTARFYEYSINADLSSRVSWAHELNETEAVEYVDNFMNYAKKISAQ